MAQHGWLVALGVGLQLLVILGLSQIGGADLLQRSLFVLSYFVLLGFVAFNWRRLGFAVIGIGLLLNLAVILANGGLMPVSPQTLERAGLGHRLPDLELGEPVPLSKNVLLAPHQIRLRPLADTLVLGKNPTGIRVFSVGDVVIAAGLVIALAQLALSALAQRRTGLTHPPQGK